MNWNVVIPIVVGCLTPILLKLLGKITRPKESIIDEYDAVLATSRELRKELEQKIEKLETKIKELEKAVEELKADKDKLKEEITNLKNQIIGLKNKLKI